MKIVPKVEFVREAVQAIAVGSEGIGFSESPDWLMTALRDGRLRREMDGDEAFFVLQDWNLPNEDEDVHFFDWIIFDHGGLYVITDEEFQESYMEKKI